MARFLICLCIAALATAGVAQTGSGWYSLEAELCRSKTAFIGEVVRTESDSSADGYTIDCRVDDLITGAHCRHIKVHRPDPFERRIMDGFASDHARLLWFIASDVSQGAEYIDLSSDAAGVSVEQHHRLPIFTMDFRLLRTEKEVLDDASKLSKSKPVASDYATINLPWALVRQSGYSAGLYANLVVPVIPQLEDIARAMINSPKNIVPFEPALAGQSVATTSAWLKMDHDNLRKDGIRLLGNFKSERNITLLKSLLTDSTVEGYTFTGKPGDTSFHYSIRIAAYQVLQDWHVNVTPPVIVASAPTPP